MWILIVSVLIDQVTKYLISNLNGTITIIPNLLSFEHVKNYGAVFGLMQGSNYIMAALSFVICIAIVVYLIMQKKNNKKINVAWYMILSGGIGNLIDRIVRGYVVDFIATPFIATFNIADSMVVIGVAILIINEITEVIKEKKQKEN